MEYWDAYTKDGTLVEDVVLARGCPIADGLYHMVCETLVLHRDGSILCMLRSRQKANYGGCYEASAGGSALRGETAVECIARELREETGLHCTRFTEVARNRYEDGHSLFFSFVCEVDCAKDAVQLQPGETDGYVWLSREEFAALLPTEKLVPTQKKRYSAYYRTLLKL